MNAEVDYQARVDTVADILERQYEKIDNANKAISQNERRANGFCGPVSQARFAVNSARIALGSAESTISFIHEVANSPEDGWDIDVAKDAIAAVAKRRLELQDGVAVL